MSYNKQDKRLSTKRMSGALVSAEKTFLKRTPCCGGEFIDCLENLTGNKYGKEVKET